MGYGVSGAGPVSDGTASNSTTTEANSTAAERKSTTPEPNSTMPDSRLLVDQSTLSDLEISGREASVHSLFNLLDRTTSSPGRLLLGERLRSPHADRGKIEAVQAALRQLSNHHSDVTALLRRAPLDLVERYLDLSWELSYHDNPLLRAAEAKYVSLRYPEFVRDVSAGLRLVSEMLRSTAALIPLLSGGEKSAILDGFCRTLGEVTATELMRRLSRIGDSRLSLSRMVQLDHAARGEGRGQMRQLLATLAELDALNALAATTTIEGWVMPDTSGDSLEIDDLRHPLMGRAVANSVRLGPHDRLVLVTGPNMAGKTTFMRACALCVHLAQMGCGVPASRMRFRPVDALFASVDARDSLEHGESLFLAEVRRVRTLAEQMSRGIRVFAVIDEPFRGTNVHDASDATEELARALSAQGTSIALVATHLVEVVERMGAMPSVRTAHFVASVNGGNLSFDYLMRAGVSSQRLGMELLRREGVIALLTSMRERQ
jgi:DNA mismatch repair ATPase MutS